MFAWFTNLFSSKAARPIGRALQLVRARYDAAANNHENRRHWANADGLSAKHSEIEAQAIREGWDATQTELEVMRADRPRGPAIHASTWDNSPQVIEAALCISRRHDVEKQFKPEVLDAADRQYRNLGFQQLFMLAAAANGYRRPLRE